MGLTISSQASYLYNYYSLINSDKYTENAVDSSQVAKDTYNVSDVSSALTALNDVTDFENSFSIGNVDSYVKNAFSASQVGTYDATKPGIVRLLSGDAGTDDIYDIIEYTDSLKTEEVDNLVGAYTATTYNDYLTKSGNILDILV